jgi:hypothetical protein
LRRIVDWDEQGMKFKDEPEDDIAAIAEIVASAGKGRPYRIKFHPKQPALDALARYLTKQNGDEPTQDEVDSARRRIMDALDRLAAEREEGADSSDPPG